MRGQNIPEPEGLRGLDPAQCLAASRMAHQLTISLDFVDERHDRARRIPGLTARILGTVPVEADGSAYFLVPSGVPVFFQALDERGGWGARDTAQAFVDLTAIVAARLGDRPAAKVQAAVAAAVTEPFGDNSRRTRAAVVVYDDQIVAEGYGPGFD